MGFLNEQGLFYDYYESLAFQQTIKEKGIIQFLNLMKKYSTYKVDNHHYEHIDENMEESKGTLIQDIKDMKIFWGDEFEGHIIKQCNEQKQICLQPNLGELFDKLAQNQEHMSFIALPEYGSWMLENTPNKPYYHLNYNLDSVIRNIRTRVKEINDSLPQNTYYLLLPVFPRLGCQPYSLTTEYSLNSSYIDKQISQTSYLDKTPTISPFKETTQQIIFPIIQQNDAIIQSPIQMQEKLITNIFSQSIFIDDRLINPHPRFSALTLNLRLRRGSKVDIRYPIYKDINTKYEATPVDPYPGFIYMDHMGFGMGNCSLQMTFLSKDISHARFLYDQFAPLTPLFLALTAGSPIYKGQLSDWDTRWDSISMSVDDRNENERNSNHQDYIPKSRYSSISHYISNNPMNREEYNDIKFRKNEQIMAFARKKAQEMGVELDEKLIQHLGILYVRDAMVVFRDKVQIDDMESTAHFENIQSTNWNSVRFKPPPSQNSSIGWRVEFRTSEIQLTADENAAISILLLKIATLFYFNNIKLNFYMPLSLVDENFKRARNSNAIVQEKFYWRKNILDEGPAEIVQLSLDEIFFGKSSIDYCGIYSIIEEMDNQYNSTYTQNESRINTSKQIMKNVAEYIRSKTTGKVRSLAQWMRGFVLNHNLYLKDSMVNHEIQYDMINHLLKVIKGEIQDQDFPNIFSKFI